MALQVTHGNTDQNIVVTLLEINIWAAIQNFVFAYYGEDL